MNILLLWFGQVEPLYSKRDACIKRMKEVYPDAHFKVVTTLKEFYGMEVIDVNEIAEKMAFERYYSDYSQFIPFSDALRFWWLSRNPNTLYLDTDTWCHKAMKPTKEAGKVKIEALWNGEQTWKFKEFLDDQIKGTIFISTQEQLEAEDLSEYFEHKPKEVK